MNQTASHLMNRTAPRSYTEWEAFIGRNSQDKELLAKERKKLFWVRPLFLKGKAVGSMVKIISLVLIRKYQTGWFKVPHPGRG